MVSTQRAMLLYYIILSPCDKEVRVSCLEAKRSLLRHNHNLTQVERNTTRLELLYHWKAFLKQKLRSVTVGMRELQYLVKLCTFEEDLCPKLDS